MRTKTRRILALLLAVLLAAGLLPGQARAAETASGSCGGNLTWSLEDGTLTISGTGPMEDYYFLGGVYAPWAGSANSIRTAVVENGVTSIGDFAFLFCGNMTRITIPASVKTIGSSAFEGAGLTDLSIPDSVENIGISAFADCTGLSAITVGAGNPAYKAVNGVLFTKAGDELFQYPAGKPDASYAVPDGTASIAAYAFGGSPNLTAVDIPASVKSVGDGAFANCTGLTSVHIPDGVTAIRNDTFTGCTGLVSVDIPASVASVGFMAFDQCTGLSVVNYPGTTEQWARIVVNNAYNSNAPLLNAEIRCSDGVVNRKGELTVNLGDREIEADFDADGNCVIDLGENPFFPYEAQFRYQGRTTTEWFLDTDSTVELDGHTVSVRFQGTAQHVGLRTESGLYLDAYPARKNFSGTAGHSLMPLEQETLTVDASALTYGELRNMRLEIVLLGEEPLWKMNRLEHVQDRYQRYQEGAVVDLTEEGWRKADAALEIISGDRAGEKVDQLNPGNKKYMVAVTFPDMSGDSYFEIAAYTPDRQKLDILAANFTAPDRYLLTGKRAQWAELDGAYFSMKYSSAEKAGLEVAVYEGLYETEAAALAANARNITEQIWNQADMTSSGGYPLQDLRGWSVTVVSRWDGDVVDVMPLTFRMSYNDKSISPSGTNLYAGTGDHRDYAAVQTGSEIIDNNDDHRLTEYTYVPLDGYADNRYYYVGLSVTDFANLGGSVDLGLSLVQRAVIGDYTDAKDLDGREDIKEQLFSDASGIGGYRADFSSGSVTFTVLTVDGMIRRLRFVITDETATDDELPRLPTPQSNDTYFDMGIPRGSEDDSDILYTGRQIRYSDDSYYWNGYQTLFLMQYRQSVGIEAVSAVSAGTLTPRLAIGNDKVMIYAGKDAVSGEPQLVEPIGGGNTLYAGVPISFRSGEIIHYSAASPNGVHLKNYWVTLLTKESGGAKLFVNAATNADDENRDKEEKGADGRGLPVREVYLNKSYGHRHDIAVLNIGDEALTGLSVKLAGKPDGTGEAVNVRLDDYWTLDENGRGTLNAFSRFKTDERADILITEMDNMAKIRLLPVTDEDGKIQEGDISGYLIISSDNGGSETIKLTGSSRTPEITTRTLSDGVKYVPYSSLIQTNNMYDSNIVKFELVKGTLPDGVVLRQNGEIYGVPKVTGSYDITVRATFFGSETQEVSYTLVIRDNTDANVWNATDADYTVTTAVGRESGANHYVWSAGSGSVFTTNGSYGGFLDFYLDGRKLEEGVDYDSREGSTVITIRDQTLSGAGAGTHTLAAEFREGNRDTGKLKRAAQNYTIETAALVTPTRPITSTKPSSSSSSGKTDNTGNSNIGSQPEPSGLPYTDTPASSWFYGDVKWAYDEGLMTGVSDTAFSPSGSISQAIIVTVLARMAQVDLDQFQDTMDGIEPGKWYTKAAVWAKQAGLLPDYGAFTGDAPISREEMAIMLVKYLRRMGKGTTPPAQPVAFADASDMSQAGNDAFQVLYAYNIFRGVGDGRMDPAGTTTRAQFAALAHRLSDAAAS